MAYQPLEWLQDRLRILDQRLLPLREMYFDATDYREVADAIKELKVRGAPAIGVAGAYGIALGALNASVESAGAFRSEVRAVIETITSTRPTARNLFWAAERMAAVVSRPGPVPELKTALIDEAVGIHEEEVDCSRRVSDIGAELIADGSTVLTHCNTGPLATTGYGTALGVIIHAYQCGKRVRVLVDETRPLLQGARLTTWELQKAGVPFTLITDSMAGHFMKQGEVSSVIVGADCIAANGDTANKVGTYAVAVLARAHRVPLYVAAPTSTIDLRLQSGDEINIEQRRAEEVTHVNGVRVAPTSVDVANPAFDVTPARYITAVITERGIMRKPLARAIARLRMSRNRP